MPFNWQLQSLSFPVWTPNCTVPHVQTITIICVRPTKGTDVCSCVMHRKWKATATLGTGSSHIKLKLIRQLSNAVIAVWLSDGMQMLVCILGCIFLVLKSCIVCTSDLNTVQCSGSLKVLLFLIPYYCSQSALLMQCRV